MSDASTKSVSLDILTGQISQIAANIKKINKSLSWFIMPADYRAVLKKAFEHFTLSDLCQLLGKDEESIARLQSEEKRLNTLLQKIKQHQSSKGTSKLMHNDEVVTDVVELARSCSCRQLAELIGNRISESTIARWTRMRLGDLERRIPITCLSAPAPVAAVPAPASLGTADSAREEKSNEHIPPDIDQSIDGRKLAALMMRHQGKKRRKYSPLEKRLIVSLSSTYGSKSVYEKYKIAYDTIARLRRRASEEFDPKPRVPLKYAPVVELMAKYPGMGPMQIKDYIRRHMGLSMGVNSVRNVMEQNGWVPPYARTSRIKDAMRHFEAVRKNYLWHLDFKHHFINQTKVAILFIQDDYSRFLVGHVCSDSENMEAVIGALEESIALHGRPEVVMTDGGSAFYSWRGVSSFTRILEDHGIDHYLAKSANVNGKIESVCAQVEKELLNVQSFSSLRHFTQELAAWIGFYNFKRPHSGLGDAHVPADRFYPGAAHWFTKESELTQQKSLIAETMATLLNQLAKPSKES